MKKSNALEVDTRNWYAAFVTTGEEERVKERLKYRLEDRFRIIVPKRKLRERKGGIWKYNIRTLFSEYVKTDILFRIMLDIGNFADLNCELEGQEIQWVQ